MAETKKAKRAAQFDIGMQHTRCIALRIVYFGGAYCGFASSSGKGDAYDPKTRGAATPGQILAVEDCLFGALKHVRLVGQDCDVFHDVGYSRCGRTDKGVNAAGQIVALRVRTKLKNGRGVFAPAKLAESVTVDQSVEPEDDKEHDFCAMLNNALPADIRVTGWCPVPETFNARFDCKFRLYRYYFMSDGLGVFAPPLDVEAMRKACTYFVGTHDFRNFCYADVVNVDSFVRTVYDVHIEDCFSPAAGAECGAGMHYFVVKGSGFLWHQVRCMAAVLFMVGRHEEPPEVVEQLLDIEKCPGKPNYAMADDGPLILYDSGYEPELKWYTPANSMKYVANTMAKMWYDMWIKQSMMSAIMKDLCSIPVVNDDGDTVSVSEFCASRKEKAKERSAQKQKDKHGGKRSLSEISKTSATLEDKIEGMKGNKRAKYEAKLEKRKAFEEKQKTEKDED